MKWLPGKFVIEDRNSSFILRIGAMELYIFDMSISQPHSPPFSVGDTEKAQTGLWILKQNQMLADY